MSRDRNHKQVGMVINKQLHGNVVEARKKDNRILLFNLILDGKILNVIVHRHQK